MPENRNGALLVNLLTGSRLLLAAGVAALTPWSDGRHWAIWSSVALVALIECTDLLDGHLARSRGVVSRFGKMFDPYADSVSRLTVYWSLAVVGRCWPVLPLVMAVRDVTVSYARIIMTRRGMDLGARYTGKLKAWFQGLGGILLMAGPLYWWAGSGATIVHVVSGAVTAVTVASMLDYVAAALGGSPEKAQSAE